MKKRTQQTSKLRPASQPVSSARVIRISAEAWAAKFVSVAKPGRSPEAAECFDRALGLDQARAS